MKPLSKPLFLVCMWVVATVSAYAQPCKTEEFPYLFCDGHGKIVTKCSADPHRERGLTPVRVNEPSCYVPAKVYPNSIEITGYPGPQVIQAFNPSQSVVDMNTAWSEWVSLCPNTQGQPSNSFCCLKVFMSRNYFDFTNAVSTMSILSKVGVDGNSCRKICNEPPTLLVNFTDDFMWQSRDAETEPAAIVWFTGNTSPFVNHDKLSCELVISFKQQIQQRMGEFFGLVERDKGTACDDPGSLMGNGQTHLNPTGLTPGDVCHFRKLYCPEVVGLGPALGIDEAAESAGISLSQNIPNPFSRMTTIPYHIDHAGDVTLILFDNTGREVKTLVNGKTEAGTYTFGFYPDNDMPAGTYWYVLKVDKTIRSRQMLLVK